MLASLFHILVKYTFVALTERIQMTVTNSPLSSLTCTLCNQISDVQIFLGLLQKSLLSSLALLSFGERFSFRLSICKECFLLILVPSGKPRSCALNQELTGLLDPPGPWFKYNKTILQQHEPLVFPSPLLAD